MCFGLFQVHLKSGEGFQWGESPVSLVRIVGRSSYQKIGSRGFDQGCDQKTCCRILLCGLVFVVVVDR